MSGAAGQRLVPARAARTCHRRLRRRHGRHRHQRPDQIAALEAEHRRIESVLAEAADGATPSDPTWPDRLMEAMAVLRDHILKEQDGVFPAALAHLSTEDREAVEATRAQAGSTLSWPAA